MRQKFLPYLFIIIAIAMMNSCSSPNDSTPIAEATLEEKIGQMLMVGFRGLEVSPDSQIIKDIKAKRIGGVILFEKDVALGTSIRNISSPQQLATLNASLQSYTQVPLFIGIDQEGGLVNRLKSKYGFPESVTQQYLGTLNNFDTTRKYASSTASTLLNANINMNFAPVVDLNVNPDNPVIGHYERSFSADPVIVTNHASIIIDEHTNRNIFCSLKHFPGHGSSKSDSHAGFVDVTETWSDSELVPYRNLINSGQAKLIMTAHIFNSKWDNAYPATLSWNVLTKMLRQELGFAGIVITDDMNMGAITSKYGTEQATELALNAGADILLFANNIAYDEHVAETISAIVKKLVDEGKVPLSRINESYQRIMNYKKLLKSQSIAKK